MAVFSDMPSPVSAAASTDLPLVSGPVDRAGVSALILGAGLGLRMGLGPKAFIKLRQTTLLEMAVAAVTPVASQIIVGVCAADEEKARTLIASLPEASQTGTELILCVGGATRQETVSLLLAKATRPLVLLHEVARPNVSEKLFVDVLAAAHATGGAALCLPLEARDSVATVIDGCVDRAVPRDSVVTLQTPHAYRRDWLLDTHAKAVAGGWKEEGTAGLVRRAGYPVKLVPGSVENVKLTFQQDLSAQCPDVSAKVTAAPQAVRP